jgi:hypothetical protein
MVLPSAASMGKHGGAVLTLCVKHEPSNYKNVLQHSAWARSQTSELFTRPSAGSDWQGALAGAIRCIVTTRHGKARPMWPVTQTKRQSIHDALGRWFRTGKANGRRVNRMGLSQCRGCSHVHCLGALQPALAMHPSDQPSPLYTSMCCRDVCLHASDCRTEV